MEGGRLWKSLKACSRVCCEDLASSLDWSPVRSEPSQPRALRETFLRWIPALNAANRATKGEPEPA